jgi:hypothetical protein
VERVLADEFPRPDRYEANDDAGTRAWYLKWREGTLTATVDYWDDQSDVYRMKLRKGTRLTATLKGPSGADVNLVLWKPGTTSIQTLAGRRIAARSSGPGSRERISRYRAKTKGQYYLEVKISRPGAGAYALSLQKR